MDESHARTTVGRVRVLASGSSGNCTVLEFFTAHGRRACLIDAGLSPKRTLAVLQGAGIDASQVVAIILTHLDHDHWNSGWVNRWPRGWHLWMSGEHASYAKRRRLAPLEALREFDAEAFEPAQGVAVTPVAASHDELGVSSFRFDVCHVSSNGTWSGSLGFATDLGRVPERFVECVRGVHVLAIESNYCPKMQMASARPSSLKQRIMNGHGHLSNDQCLHAITSIEPRDHVILLHLSRECNDPSLVASLHEGSDYALTISDQEAPSRWVEIAAGRRREAAAPRVGAQLEMFPAGAP
jgi:phosphoribosyl 1,2-cyclic phosphodiesterase